MVHGSAWRLIRTPAFWAMDLACCGSSAAGSVLGVWQPQLLKSYGLTNIEIGLVNSVPYGIAAIAMVLWGRHSDASGERRWHTALPLLLIAVRRRIYHNEDGQVITLGGRSITALLTPGHTPGTVSLLFPASDKGVPHLASLFGGQGSPCDVASLMTFRHSLGHFVDCTDRM